MGEAFASYNRRTVGCSLSEDGSDVERKIWCALDEAFQTGENRMLGSNV
jgi:hypothetical protein